MMNARGVAKTAAAVTVMTMLPLNAAVAQSVRASQALPSTTVADIEGVRAGAELQAESQQLGTAWWLLLLILGTAGFALSKAFGKNDDRPRSPNT